MTIYDQNQARLPFVSATPSGQRAINALLEWRERQKRKLWTTEEEACEEVERQLNAATSILATS